jgi:hypothetical protein
MTLPMILRPLSYIVTNPLAQFRSVSQWTGGLCCRLPNTGPSPEPSGRNPRKQLYEWISVPICVQLE